MVSEVFGLQCMLVRTWPWMGSCGHRRSPLRRPLPGALRVWEESLHGREFLHGPSTTLKAGIDNGLFFQPGFTEPKSLPHYYGPQVPPPHPTAGHSKPIVILSLCRPLTRGGIEVHVHRPLLHVERGWPWDACAPPPGPEHP